MNTYESDMEDFDDEMLCENCGHQVNERKLKSCDTTDGKIFVCAECYEELYFED